MDIIRGRKVSQFEKERKFISPQQTLADALGQTDPKFRTLYDELYDLQGASLYLPEELKQKCKDTFILLLKNEIKRPGSNLADFGSFQNLLEDCITFMIMNCGKTNYVQCAMIDFKDYSLKHQTLNFSKAILETSHIKDLFKYISQKSLYDIICNYTIILKYQNDYVQVAGKPLNMDFSPLINLKKKKITPQNNKAQNSGNNIDPFDLKIKRNLIFYCSHINRSSGLFHRNLFFDKGITVSNSKEELKIVLTKISGQFKKNFPQMKALYFERFQKLLQELLRNVRNVFSLRTHKGKQRCYFQCMIKNFCSLPVNYQSLKTKTYLFIRQKKQPCEQLFDQLYSATSQYSSVTRLLRRLLDEIVPQYLIGKQNLQCLKTMMKDFVQMKRYENFGMQDYLYRMNVFEIPWLEMKFNRKFKNRIIKRGQKILGEILSFIINEILIPIIKFHFYVTEQHKEANKIFYFRKPVWILIAKLALYKFSQQNLNKLNSEQADIIRASSEHFPQGKLRILPKKGTFRPIITFNKKMKVQKNSSVKQTLQKILSNTQLVLRNMKNNLWQRLGFSVFDNRQIKKKFDAFIQKWRENGCPKLAYFTLDIKKCYDSINTQKLLQIIETTPFIEDFYFIKKYQRLYRNKRPLIGSHNITSYFNHKERIAASPLSKDPLLVHQNDTIPSFTVFSTKQKSITKEKVLQNLRELCRGSIINYKKQSWSQNYGIPQGLNVSGVLCSLYFGTLQNRHIKKYVKKGLLMRLTDDYLYLGQQQEAKQVLSKLMKCARQNQFKFSDSKMSKNFFHPQYPKVDEKDYLIWIGKKINIKTLYMEPYFEQSEKIQYAMNVNLKRTNIKGFMKNKLKSLLTNHFESYFKPKIFSESECIETIKIYVKVSLEKFFPFLKRFFILQLPNPQLILIQILESTFHDYAVYICMLMKKCQKQAYLTVKKHIVEETACFFSKRKSESEFKFIHFSYLKKLKSLSNLLIQHQRQGKGAILRQNQQNDRKFELEGNQNHQTQKLVEI